MIEFLAGAVTATQLIAGLFFLKFWRRTGDKLFLSFAIAFWLLALSQSVGSFVDLTAERRAVAYLPRLLGFLLILVSIVRTNLARTGSKPPTR